MGVMKIIGIVLSGVSALVLIVLIVLTLVLPPGFWMGVKSVDDYNDWIQDAEQGDQITVYGELESENVTDLLGVKIYSYKFKGSDHGFLSSNDIGSEGEKTVVEII